MVGTKVTCLISVKESFFTKIGRFIRGMLGKNIKQPVIKNSETSINEMSEDKRNKKEMLEIYNKAKNNEYDLTSLKIEEIKILNQLIEEEIKIKTEKLNSIRKVS